MPYLLAGGAALASFALVSAGSYVLSGKIDGYKSIDRDRYLIAGGAGLLGLYLALKKKKPLLGAAVAGGAVISAVGIKATEMVSKLLQPKAPPTMSAVFGQDMSGYNRMQGYERIGDYERLAAVYGQDMSAVYGQDMAGIGELPPGPPWASPSPF